MSTGQTEDDGAEGKLTSQPVKCSVFVDVMHKKAHGLCYREKALERDRFLLGMLQKGLKVASSSLFSVVPWKFSQHQMCEKKREAGEQSELE